MYTTSDNYKLKRYNTPHLLKVFINDVEVNSKYILDCKPSQKLFLSDEFTLGSITSKAIDLKVYKAGIPNTIDNVKIKSGITGEEIPVGVFNLDDISKDNDYTITLKLLDNMIKFEFNYDGSTLLKNNGGKAKIIQVLNDICSKAGVELGSTSFLNMNKEISVYDNTISARIYLSYISEQAGGFACIGRDGKLYIKTIGETIDTLPLKYFQNFKWGEKFKITRVKYEDGIQLFEKGDSTGNTLYINQENMFIVDQEQIDNIYNKIKDLEVYSFEGDSIIDPAIDIGDILLIDGKKVIYQGSSEFSKKWKASISSKIQIKAKEETTSRTPSQKVINRRVQSQINQAEASIKLLTEETKENSSKTSSLELDLDKIKTRVESNEKSITEVKNTANDALNKTSANSTEIAKTNTALSEITQTTESIKSRVETTENTVETINGELKLTDNVNGYPIHIENAGAYKAIDYTVAGNSEQKTRSGKNKLKINNGYSATSNGVAISISNDGTITLNGTATAQVNFSIISNNPYLTSNLPYTLNCIYTAGTVNGTATLYLQDKNNSYDGYGLKLTNSNSFSKRTFKNDMTLQSNVFRIASGTVLSNYKIKFQLVQVDKNDYDYEEYGASPSPDFPSSIKTVGIKSFIKDSDIHTSNNSLYYLGSNYWYSNNKLSECIELEANTIYTFSCKTYTSDNKITLMDSSKTALTRVNLTRDYTFTTTQKCWLHYYSNGNTEQPKWQLINCGTQIDDLSYGNWLINKITGKNLLKLDDKLIAGYTTTVQGITYTFNQNGSITISGTTGANMSSIVLLGDNLNNYATKRWHEDEDIVVNFSVAGLALKCRLTSGAYSSLANAKGKDVGVIYLAVNPNTTIDTTIYPFVTYEASNSFEIYKENIIKLNLQGNELAKIGNVYDEVNIATGILTKRIGKVVLNGSENWGKSGNSNDNFFCGALVDQKLPFQAKMGTNNDTKTNYFIRGNRSSNSEVFDMYNGTEYYKVFALYLSTSKVSDIASFKTWLSTHNTEVYYVLETPETIQLEAQKIELFEGENNVKIISDLNPSTTHLNYYTKSGLNNVYQEQFAQQEITNNSIEQRVSASEENTASLEKKYTSLSETVEGFDFNVFKDIQEKIENGDIKSNIVETTTVRIDADGLHTKKSGSQMQSLLDNEGMYVNNGDIDKTSTKNNTLTVDKDGVVTENLYVRTYATLGYHRTEGFSENGELRTGVFYQGGEV